MIYRSCLLVAGIVLWWMLLDTANQFADQRSMAMVDRQTFAFMVHHKPPLGKVTTRVEIRDLRFNLLRRSPELNTKPNAELVGSGPLFLSWLYEASAKEHQLHLFDTRDFSSRIVRSATPFAATGCRITRDGKWLILVADSKVNYFKMYSIPDLKEVDSIELGGKYIRPLDTELGCVDNSPVVLFVSGRFEVYARPALFATAQVYCANEGAILYWMPQLTSIDGKSPSHVFVNWPKTNRTEPVYVPVENSRPPQWQLANDGQWIISPKREGNSSFRVVSCLNGDEVCRIQLNNNSAADVEKWFLQELDTFKWRSTTNRLEIWDADTCSIYVTFDLYRYLMPKLLVIVVLLIIWCSVWWVLNCSKAPTFTGILGATVGLSAIFNAFSILFKMDQSIPYHHDVARQLHLLVGYVVIPVASWWIAFSNENWLSRIAQSTILLGLSWLGSTTDQLFEIYQRIVFVVVPILLSAVTMSLLKSWFSPKTIELATRRRIGIRDLMLLGIAVGFVMHLLGYTENSRLKGSDFSALLRFAQQEQWKVMRVVLVITLSQAGLVLLCYGGTRLRIKGLVLFAASFGWFCTGYKSTQFEYFRVLSYGFLIMLAVIPIPALLYWLTQRPVGRFLRNRRAL